MSWLGGELSTLESWVRRPNHLPTEPFAVVAAILPAVALPALVLVVAAAILVNVVSSIHKHWSWIHNNNSQLYKHENSLLLGSSLHLQHDTWTMDIILLLNHIRKPNFNSGHFYHATACNATNGIALAILSVCLSDACIVTKLNDALRIFWHHTKRQSL